MHILIIHQAFASINEPGGTRHYEFARLLAERGNKVTIIASPISYITGSKVTNSSVGSDQENDLTILRANVYSAHHKSFYHRIIAFFSFMLSSFWIGIGVKNVDIVWGTSPPIFQGFTAWILARLKGAKFLFEVRDLWPEFAIAIGVLKTPVVIRMSEWLEHFLYTHADQIIVNSPGFINHVKTHGGRKVDLVSNGADPDMFKPSNKGTKFRHAYGLEGKFVALYAGAHGMSNDLDVVLDAAELLQSKPDTSEKTRTIKRRIQFVLLGDGKEKSTLQRRASTLGLTNVLFLPSVQKNEIPGILAGTDACIAILRPLDEYKTTYPNKVFDYMAAGRPVVLVIDGVIRQVVETAGCGVFVKPGDAKALARAIRTLAADQVKCRVMGVNGRKYLVHHFNRKEITEKLVTLCEKLAINH